MKARKMISWIIVLFAVCSTPAIASYVMRVKDMTLRAKAYTLLECSARSKTKVNPNSKATVKIYSCENYRGECRVGVPLNRNVGRCITHFEMWPVNPSGRAHQCSLLMYFQKVPRGIIRTDNYDPHCVLMPRGVPGAIDPHVVQEVADDFAKLYCEARATGEYGVKIATCWEPQAPCRTGVPLAPTSATCAMSFYLEPEPDFGGSWLYCKAPLFFQKRLDEPYIYILNRPQVQCRVVDPPKLQG